MSSFSRVGNTRWTGTGRGLTRAGLIGSTILLSWLAALSAHAQEYVTFDLASKSTIEGDAGYTLKVQVVDVNGASVAATNDITVTLSPYENSDLSSSGHADGVITILKDQTEASLDITAMNDALDEDDEVYTLELTGPVNASLGTTFRHELTIIDEDPMPSVSFEKATWEVGEDEGTYDIVVKLSASSGKTVTVDFEVGGTAANPDQYTIAPATSLTIDPENDTGIITITLVDDALWEPNVTVQLTMLNAGNADIVSPSQHALTISDNEAQSEFFFDHADPDGDGVIVVSRREEDPPTFNATIKLAPPSSQEEQVRVVVSGTATAADLTAPLVDQMLTFAAGQTSQQVTFTALDDDLYENDETVILGLQKLTGANVGQKDTYRAIIEQGADPAPEVTFSAGATTAAEDGAAFEVEAQLNFVAGKDIELPFTASGSAVTGVDYLIAASPLIVQEGQTTATLQIAQQLDGSDEDEETVVVTFGTPPEATLIPPGEFTFTITDIDDPPLVSFRAATQSALEGTPSVKVYVDVTPASGKIVKVPFALIGGTATSPTHYNLLSSSPLTVNPGETEGFIELELPYDPTDEADRTLGLVLQDPVVNGTLGTITNLTLTIQDTDPQPEISFTVTNQTVSEAEVTHDITAVLDRDSEQTVTVGMVFSGDATEGDTEDYTKTTDTLTFAPGDTSKTFQVTVKTDTLYERDEEIVATLINPENATLDTDKVHILTITDDDDAPTVSFATATKTVQEDTAAPRLYIRVELSERAGRDISIPFTLGGTATETSDFTISASPHVIPEGNLGASIIIDLINDDADEDEENIVLTLLDPPDGSTLIAPIIHTVTIQDDDDPPTVQFSLTGSQAAEDAGEIQIAVQVTPASGKEIVVPFTLNAASTAGDPDDYELNPTDQLVIPAGASSANIAVTLKTDALDEDSETVVLNLDTPQNASLSTQTSHTLTITDITPQPDVHFTIDAQSGDEDAGDVTIRVSLTAISERDVSVPLTLGGTTAEGADYTLSENPVVIAAGQLTRDLIVTVVDDDMDEFDETLVLTMNQPTNGNLSASEPIEHTLTVTDNDAEPTVALTTGQLEVNEDVGEVRITAQLSIVSGKEVTVPFTFSGSAIKGEDYTVSAESIVIPPNAGSVDLIVTVIDDDLKEDAEAVITTMGTPVNASRSLDVDAFLEHTLDILDNEPEPKFTVSFAFAGEGTGVVSREPGGEEYALGTVLMLTAIPGNGSEFTGWSGDLTGAENPTTIEMDGNKSITATFGIYSPKMFTLQVSTAGTGAGNITLSPPGGTYLEGTVVTLTATSASGSVFDAFSGDVTSDINPANVLMDSAKSVTATFSTSTGADPSAETQTFLLTKGLIKLNFKLDGKDQLTILGQLPTPAGFVAENHQVTVVVAGISRTFTLNAKGKARLDNDRFMVKIKGKGEVLEQSSKFKAVFRKGTFRTELAAVGAVNEDLLQEPIVVPIRITYNDVLHGLDQSFNYKGKKDKKGIAKTP